MMNIGVYYLGTQHGPKAEEEKEGCIIEDPLKTAKAAISIQYLIANINQHDY